MEENKLYTIAVASVVLAAIFGMSIYHINDRVLMANNVDKAIAKGINPMSVRCSYVRGDDPICIAFASKAEDITATSSLPGSAKK
jgi:uncharacterized membrane protein